MKMSDLKPSVVRKTFRVDQGDIKDTKQELSKTKIVAEEKRHNAKVNKMAKDNYGIPVVFFGLNL